MSPMGSAAGGRDTQGPPVVGDRARHVRETFIGIAATVLLVVLIYLGSNGLSNFDSALIGYAVGIVALTFAVVYRYARWLRMPSTGRYWRRGWQLLTSWSSFRSLPGLLPRAVAGQLLGQGFIRRRGWVRWIAHQCLFWGVIGATLITFPLVFGWLAFKLEPGTTETYRMWVFGVRTITFDTTSFFGWSMFHALDYTAVLVVIGCTIFLWRRFRDRAVIAGQRFGYDMVPLLMLVVIAVTGMLLTASASLFHGSHYGFLVIVHMAAVVLALVFIPYGKFFHVLQRPASVGIQMYVEVNGREERQPCARCGEPLASAAFIDDLQATLHDLGQDYRLDRNHGGGREHEQGSLDSPGRLAAHLIDLCPRCKRVARAESYFDASGSSFAR